MSFARLLGWPLARVGPPFDTADAIVVLGAPLRKDGQMTAVLEERVQAGVALWKRGVAPILCLTGGRTRGGEVAEAEAMAERARALGAGGIVVESESRSTFENARNAAALLLPRGCRRVVVVSQPFHLARARLHFRRAGFGARGHFIEDSLQFRSASGLRWVLREYPSLLRDWLLYSG